MNRSISGPRCPVDGGTAAVAEDYWSLVRADRRLLVQGCASCGAVAFPPRMRCLDCGGDSLEWWPAGESGRLLAAVPVLDENPRHRPPRRLRDRLPYVTAIVEPDDWPGVRLPTLLVDDGSLAGRFVRLAVGIAAEDRDGRMLPISRVAGAAG